ncbi:MAG: tetratricopeptide repeat protein, partial [Bryobacteraceae bacterium]
MALRLLIAILILAVPAELPGCGPFLPEALFYLAGAPEKPAEFGRGQLGIVQPAYERLYQVIAYRYLSGVGLNDAEQKAVLPPSQPAMDAPARTVTPNPWLAARNNVPGTKPLREINPYRQVKRAGYFDTYLNCNDDAFRTAASTLKRVQQAGAAAEWIAAQDIVFAGCSQGTAIPQSTTDPHLAPDRAYQIASAKFYSEQYDASRQDFQTIALDASSPWHDVAPYLAARCLIRAGKLAEAETALQRIAADSTLARWHGPANRLLGYVRARLHPAQRMHELALALVQPDSQATIGQDLIDYRVLFDKDVKPQPNDDLTDWILSFHAGGMGGLEKWRAGRTLPWLIAALQAAHLGDTAVPELLAAARQVKPDSPGFVTVSYSMLRLLPPDDARAKAGELLAGNLPFSARNQFRARRLELARSFEEFLEFAPRRPVAELTDDVNSIETEQDYLDDDAANIVDRDLPLALLKQAAVSDLLPDHVRQALARAISVRALVLSDAPPFGEVLALLNTPGMRPYVDSGYGRYTNELAKIDPYRDNWWCSAGAFNVPDHSILRKPDDTGAP